MVIKIQGANYSENNVGKLPTGLLKTILEKMTLYNYDAPQTQLLETFINTLNDANLFEKVAAFCPSFMAANAQQLAYDVISDSYCTWKEQPVYNVQNQTCIATTRYWNYFTLPITGIKMSNFAFFYSQPTTYTGGAVKPFINVSNRSKSGFTVTTNGLSVIDMYGAVQNTSPFYKLYTPIFGNIKSSDPASDDSTISYESVVYASGFNNTVLATTDVFKNITVGTYNTSSTMGEGEGYMYRQFVVIMSQSLTNTEMQAFADACIALNNGLEALWKSAHPTT